MVLSAYQSLSISVQTCEGRTSLLSADNPVKKSTGEWSREKVGEKRGVVPNRETPNLQRLQKLEQRLAILAWKGEKGVSGPCRFAAVEDDGLLGIAAAAVVQ